MAKLKHTSTGVVVNVRDDKAARMVGRDWAEINGGDTAASGYAAMKVAELRGVIAARNEGRAAEDLIPLGAKKAEMVAALEADDVTADGATADGDATGEQ